MYSSTRVIEFTTVVVWTKSMLCQHAVYRSTCVFMPHNTTKHFLDTILHLHLSPFLNARDIHWGVKRCVFIGYVWGTWNILLSVHRECPRNPSAPTSATCRSGSATRDGTTECLHFACILNEFWGAAVMHSWEWTARWRGTPAQVFFWCSTVHKVTLQRFVAHEDGQFSWVSELIFWLTLRLRQYILSIRYEGYMGISLPSIQLTPNKCLRQAGQMCCEFRYLEFAYVSSWSLYVFTLSELEVVFKKNKPMSFQSVAPRKNAKISLAEISSKMMFKSIFSRKYGHLFVKSVENPVKNAKSDVIPLTHIIMPIS